MTCPADSHHRRCIRLPGFDYGRAGAYFVTVCAARRACVLGDVVDREIRLNDGGRIVQECWQAIPEHFGDVQLGEFVVMPNHVHGIVCIVGARQDSVGTTHVSVGARHASPLQTVLSPEHAHAAVVSSAPPSVSARGPTPRSIGAIVGAFKSSATKRINEIRGTPGAPVWQRNYYEHVIRNEKELNHTRQYVLDNPMRWAFDRENPEAREAEPELAWLA